jgi:hypothetical protein
MKQTQNIAIFSNLALFSLLVKTLFKAEQILSMLRS